MDKETIWFVTIFIWLLISVAGASLAKKKNRSGILWFIICLASGLLGLLVLACSRTLSYDEEYVAESDDLGFWLAIVCLIAQLLSFHYVYHFY